MQRTSRLLSITALVAALVPTPAALGAADPIHLVVCAPGYPGSTEQAQPTMDEFAAMIAAASGRGAGSVSAEYHETEQAGLARIAAADTGLALVPLPFFLKHERERGLSALLQLVQESGSSREVWSLVAPAGRVADPAALEGWELIGIPAYAPAFIRGPALGQWGELPAGVALTFTRRVLAAVRRAMAGENVLVLLDGAQTAALDSLPGKEAIEVVASSPPLLSGLLVSVGGRLTAAQAEGIAAGMLRVHEERDFDEILQTLRLVRFEQLDIEALAAAREAHTAALAAAATP